MLGESFLKSDDPFCVILTGGKVDTPRRYLNLLQKASYIIAADSGLFHLEAIHMKPNLIVGDFDSYKQPIELNEKYFEVETLTYPAEKDYTDTELAIIEAVERGFDQIILIGATGTRLDHTFANVLLLKRLDEFGVRGLIIDDHNEIFLMKGTQQYLITHQENAFFSIVPLSTSIIVTMEGFKYPLKNQHVPFASTMTISNEVVKREASVIMHDGLALAMYTRD